MKKTFFILIIVLSIVAIGCTVNFCVFSDSSQSLFKAQKKEKFPFEGDFKEDELLVKYKDLEKGFVSGMFGDNINKPLSKKGLFTVKKNNEESLEDLYNKLKKDSDIEYIEPNYKIKSTATPNDTYFSNQWNLTKISSEAGWDQETGDSAITIAVIDSGVNYNHNDLSSKIWNNPGETGGGKEANTIDDDTNGYVDDWHGWDFINNDNDPIDDNGHGTSVAGIAAAITNNGAGVAGVDWNAKIVPLKVLDSDGAGYISQLISAIEYVDDNNIDIANMSLGSYSHSASLETAVDDAFGNGVMLAAAAGNNDIEVILYPARYDNVLAVAATNQQDERCDVSDWGYDGYGYPQGSNYGPEMDVAAPGVSLYSTRYSGVDSYTSSFGGTSGATPQVAGLMALVKAKFPAFTASEIYNHIRYLSKDLGSPGHDNYFGYGRIDIERTLDINLTVNNAADLTQRLSINNNPLNWDYWWNYEVPNNSTYRDWFFNDIITSDSEIFSMFWDKAVPYYWSDGYYHGYFWDTLVPTKAVSGYYHDKFWDQAIPNGWAFNYYFSTLWDSASPSKWASSYYVGKLWDYAIPNKWANKFYFTNFWDKFVPKDWSSGYYQNSFWNYAVPQNWTGAYYKNTLNSKAIPNKWAGGYYKYMP